LTTIAESAALDVPGLQQHRLEAGGGQAGVQPLRERSGLQADAGQRQTELAEETDERLRLAGDLGLAHDLPVASTTHTLLRSSETSIPA
jgi:hypothetical protein